MTAGRRRRRRRHGRLGAAAYEHDPDVRCRRADRLRPVHAARAPGRLGCPRRAPVESPGDHLRRPARSPDGARQGRRRDGRLQHVLRDLVLRQAGADHAAHRAAARTVHPRPRGPPNWVLSRCCRRQRARSARMAAALLQLTQQAPPSSVVVPACSTACPTSTSWRASGSTAAATHAFRPSCGATHEGEPSAAAPCRPRGA